MKEIKCRKGATTKGLTVVVGIALFLVLFFIIMPFLNVIKGDASSKIDEYACLESVEIAQRSHKFLGDVLDCETQYHEIENKNADETMKTIADNMDWCWFQFKEGEEELFPHTNDNYCVVCDVFEFKDKQAIVGFREFLSTDTLSGEIKLKHRNKTHLEFLQRVKMDDEELQKFESISFDGVIDPSINERYAAVFIYGKNSSSWANHYLLNQAKDSDYLGWMYYGTAMFAGRSIGADWDAQVMLIPYNEEELKEICEILS